MSIMIYQNGPFMVNTYLYFDEATNDGIIIDAGSLDMGPLIENIKKHNITIKAIVSTHGHWDHVAGVDILKNEFKAPFYLNEKEKPVVDAIATQAQMFGVQPVNVPPIDEDLPESGTITIGSIDINCLYTPGHSPGSISLHMDDVVFSGDALFNMSIGRTDLPGGDYNELISSIREKLLPLPDKTIVYSGHGPETTIEFEKQTNPFLS